MTQHHVSSVATPATIWVMDVPLTTSLKQFVRARRERLGMTQTALAARAGLSKSEVNAVENGRVILPGADKRRRLAQALGVAHLDLLIAAGEITAEESGPTSTAPFSLDDPRSDILDLLPQLSHEDAESAADYLQFLLTKRDQVTPMD